MNQLKIQIQKGLVLLEIVIGLLILAVLLPLLVPNWPEIVGRNVSERTIEETLTIWDASRNYYAANQQWPDEINGCANAITVMEAANDIGNVGPNNAWGNAITTACTPGTSTMQVNQPVATDWRGYILGQLPASTDVGANNVSTVIPAPGTSAQTQTQLSRIAVPGSPELNRMETDLDMSGNDINNAGTITAEEVKLSTTGAELSSLGTWKFYNYSTGYWPGTVPKPNCPAGKTPDTTVVPVYICTNRNATKPIERIHFQKYSYSGYWRIRARVFAENSYYLPTSSQCSTYKVYSYCR